MFGKVGGKILGGAFRGIANKIRERRIRKGKRLLMPNQDFGRADRLKITAQLQSENESLKLKNGELKYTQNKNVQTLAGSNLSIVDKIKNFDWQSVVKFLPLLGVIPLVYFFIKNRKPKRKTYRRKKKANAVSRKTGQRSIAGTRSAGKPNMPKKYQSGCKGKKGKELGSCLQWWRKFRSGKATKK